MAAKAAAICGSPSNRRRSTRSFKKFTTSGARPGANASTAAVCRAGGVPGASKACAASATESACATAASCEETVSMEPAPASWARDNSARAYRRATLDSSTSEPREGRRGRNPSGQKSRLPSMCLVRGQTGSARVAAGHPGGATIGPRAGWLRATTGSANRIFPWRFGSWRLGAEAGSIREFGTRASAKSNQRGARRDRGGGGRRDGGQSRSLVRGCSPTAACTPPAPLRAAPASTSTSRGIGRARASSPARRTRRSQSHRGASGRPPAWCPRGSRPP